MSYAVRRRDGANSDVVRDADGEPCVYYRAKEAKRVAGELNALVRDVTYRAELSSNRLVTFALEFERKTGRLPTTHELRVGGQSDRGDAQECDVAAFDAARQAE